MALAWITGKWWMEHGMGVYAQTDHLMHSAPDATVINASLSMASNNKSWYANAVDDGTVEVEDFIKNSNITRSVGGIRQIVSQNFGGFTKNTN